ncbi:MAG: type II toxin-antitoxin system death-on-curing family toxin [Planctomycetota bacterium]
MEPRFLTVEEVLGLHAIAIARYGGTLGVRDKGLLESAVAMAQQSAGGEYLHSFPFGMAAAYAFHLGKNHPFVDGNKRVALLAAIVFLHTHGLELSNAGDTGSADVILDVIEDRLDKDGLAEWLEQHSRPRGG